MSISRKIRSEKIFVLITRKIQKKKRKIRNDKIFVLIARKSKNKELTGFKTLIWHNERSEMKKFRREQYERLSQYSISPLQIREVFHPCFKTLIWRNERSEMKKNRCQQTAPVSPTLDSSVLLIYASTRSFLQVNRPETKKSVAWIQLRSRVSSHSRLKRFHSSHFFVI